MNTGIISLLPTATEGTLHLVLDTLLVVTKVDADTTAHFQQMVVPYILAVWSKNTADSLITEIIQVSGVVCVLKSQEILEVIAAIPVCYPYLQSQILPAVDTILKAEREMPGLTEEGIYFVLF